MAKNQNTTEKKPAAPGSKPQAPKHRRSSGNKRPNKAALVENATRDEMLSELESTPMRKNAPRHHANSKMTDADLHRAGGLVAMLEPEAAQKSTKGNHKPANRSTAGKQQSAPAKETPNTTAPVKSEAKKTPPAPTKAASPAPAAPAA